MGWRREGLEFIGGKSSPFSDQHITSLCWDLWEQVTAGIDLAFAFIKAKYPNGTAIAEDIAGHLEHTIIDDWRDDPWADYYGVPPQN